MGWLLEVMRAIDGCEQEEVDWHKISPESITLYDIETGKSAVVNDKNITMYSWCEGNWSCNCNRLSAIHNDNEEEEWQDFPCFGKPRAFVVDFKGAPGFDLSDLNSDATPEEIKIAVVSWRQERRPEPPQAEEL